MIIPRLYGRLGNQCFQIATAIAHAKKMESEWAVPRVTQDQRTWPHYFLHTVNRHRITAYSTRNYYQERRHCYDELPVQYDLTIDGYFQSEKYFENSKFEISNALNLHCDKKDYIAVHVRRGDYVTHYSDKWPPLDMNYYKMAMEFFGSGLPDRSEYGYYKFKIYSDDIEWCKKMFDQKRELPDGHRWINWMAFNGPLDIQFSTIKDPLTDMRDMYNAAGFIISNSTFSLFPALLRLDNPPVIAPDESKWYGPGNSHLETCDLMPERFIKI